LGDGKVGGGSATVAFFLPRGMEGKHALESRVPIFGEWGITSPRGGIRKLCWLGWKYFEAKLGDLCRALNRICVLTVPVDKLKNGTLRLIV
jgi:hypothetical protein